jgi:hypothetical protein
MVKNHPRVMFYLSKDEYDVIRKIADSKKLTLKDLVIETLKGFVNFQKDLQKHYEEGYNKGYKNGQKRL